MNQVSYFNKIIIISFFVLKACLLLAACGYRLGGYPCQELASTERVKVPVFDNQTHEPRVENWFTQAFRKRLQGQPCLSLATGSQADAVLNGTIKSIEIFPVAVDSEFWAMEYGLRLLLSVSLVSADDGRILWEAERLSGETRFYASSDPLLARENREESLMILSEKMTERIMDKLLLEFKRTLSLGSETVP